VRRRRSSRHLAVAAVACAAALGGCNILGPASYFAFGQSKIPPRYVLLDQSTLVFVDDRSNVIPLNATQVRRTIADQVSMDLMNQEILTDTLSSSAAMVLARQHDRQEELLSIGAIGEATGARQVIYVEMLSFRGSPDGVAPRPTASCRVKVIDVANGVRLFPPPGGDLEWEELSVVSPPISPELYRSSTGRREIDKMLALLTGDQIGKLFYEHVPDEIGSRLTAQ
jgi:hypothetical protein